MRVAQKIRKEINKNLGDIIHVVLKQMKKAIDMILDKVKN